MKTSLRYLLCTFFFVQCLMGLAHCLADTIVKPPLAKQSVTNVPVASKDGLINKLNDISESIKEQKKGLAKKQARLKKTTLEQDQNALQEEINVIKNSISQQEKSFEMLLTEGLSLNGVEPTDEIKFDWQKDLLEILQPIMNELHQLTALKRERNHLEKRMSIFQSRIQSINQALVNMERTNKGALKQTAFTRFEQLQEKLKNQLLETQHLLEVTKLQYDDISRAQMAEPTMGDQIKQFVAGRGVTLILAVAAFLLVFFLMKFLWKFIVWGYKQTSDEKKTYLQRVIALVFHIAMVLLSIAAVFYVFNLRNDQVLTGMGVLLLVIIIWALKNSLPGYIAEIQTFLHAGPVREGERIVYNGMPLKVGDLNFHTKLINPDLPGLIVRLPLSELLNYISRPSSSEEPWFPCKLRDFVLLSDGTFGMVKHISIESVVLSLSDGKMPKTYTTSDFLAASPRNLSQGFFVTSDFGIDYQYQENCTIQIPEIFRMGIQKGIQQESFGSALLDLTVQFSQANASSLDYKILAKFDGKAAGDYYPIIRALQRYAVEVCNQQQWEIPFAQLTIHRQADRIIS